MSGRSLAALLTYAICVSTSYAQERIPLIINGTVTDAFPAVGIVGQEAAGGFCTGTLISPNHVLTAAHCAEAILDYGTEDTGTFEVGGRTYRTSRVSIIASYNSRQFTDDVAVLVLEEPVAGIEPALLSDVPPEIGEAVTVVGFGGAGSPETGSDGTFGTKRVGTVVVDEVTADEFSWNFDNPNESNAAPGDSGAPVFIDTGEALLIAGIVSSGTTSDAALGDTNFNMRIDAYREFIAEAVESTLVTESPSEEQPVDEEPVAELPPAEEPAAEEQPADEDASSCRPRKPGCRSDSNSDGSNCKSPCKPVCEEETDGVATSSETDEPSQEIDDVDTVTPGEESAAEVSETVTDVGATSGGVADETSCVSAAGQETAASPLSRRSWRPRKHSVRRGSSSSRPRSSFLNASRYLQFEAKAKSPQIRTNVRRR